MIETIRKLAEAYGPSGREEDVHRIILEELKNHIDGYKFDRVGNLIVWKDGKSGKKVMLDAHSDEIGLVVTNIDKNGFLRVETVGGVPPHPYVGQRVKFPQCTGIVYVEGETSQDMKKNFSNLSFDVMYVDIGASSYEEAQKVAPIGTFGVYDSRFMQNGDFLTSKAMDDRVGCAVVIEVLKRLNSPNNTVYCSFSTQEEIGLMGARVAGYDIMPEACIAIDVTASSDTPKAFKRHAMVLKKGPAIKVKDRASISDRKIVDKLIELAEESGIPYQMEVLTMGGTNAAAFQATASGIASATVSIPTRYVHTPSETVHLDDIKNCVNLLIEYVQKGV